MVHMLDGGYSRIPGADSRGSEGLEITAFCAPALGTTFAPGISTARIHFGYSVFLNNKLCR